MQSVLTTNTYIVCIQFPITESVEKLFSRVDNFLTLCRERLISTNKREQWTEYTASQKKTLEEKVRKKHFLSSFQEIESTQTSGPVIADRVEQVIKFKFELELTKMTKFVDCLLNEQVI